MKTLILVMLSVVSLGAQAVMPKTPVKNCYSEFNAWKGRFILALQEDLNADQKEHLKGLLSAEGLTDVYELERLNIWFVSAPVPSKISVSVQKKQIKVLEKLVGRQVKSVSCDYKRRAL